jgi:arylformamidase
MPLREGMPVYAGNPPFRRIWTRRGRRVNESRLEVGAHCGTHVDAPLHFHEGLGVEAIALKSLVGWARLMEFPLEDVIDRADLEQRDWSGVEQMVLKTRNSEQWRCGLGFDEGCVHLTGLAVEFLVSRRLLLVGTDGLGIDRFGSLDHPAHHALLRAGITIVEGLCLAGVPPGDYLLFCGPLLIEGSDGAPARVLLADTGSLPAK